MTTRTEPRTPSPSTRRQNGARPGPSRRLTRGLTAFALGLLAASSALPTLVRAEDQSAVEQGAVEQGAADESAVQARLDAANEAFAAARYEEAEQQLEQLVTDEGFAPGVLLNLGNTYLEQGELGHAILAYERARLLEPFDAAVEQNLRLARERAEVAAPAVSRAEQLASLWPSRRWLTVGGAALAVFILACVLAGLLRRGRWAATGLGVVSGAAVAACAAALWIGTFGVDRAIVVDGPVTARVSPFAEADPVFDTREGETVGAVDVHGDFVRVERPDGSAGWVPAAAIEAIVPGALRAAPRSS